MLKGLLATGVLELLIPGLSSLFPKRPFVEGALDVVLLEKPDAEKPVVLRDVPLDAPLLAVPPKILPVEVAFKV